LNDYGKAEDQAQETFVKFYNSVHRIRDLKKFKGYLFQIARRLCMDQLRKTAREILVSPIAGENNTNKTIHDYVKPSENTPETLVIEREKREQSRILVNEKMKELNPDQRTAIFLVHFEGLTYEEASKVLECPIGSVKSRVNRGILKLGELLENHIK